MNAHIFITFFDRLGHKPQLFFKQQERDTSLVGAILSVLVGLAICVITLYYFTEFFLGIGMTVISSKDNLQQEISLNLQNKLFMFKLTDSSGNPINHHVANLYGVHWDVIDETSNLTYFKLETCEYERHFPTHDYKNIVNHLNVSSYFCFEPQPNIINFNTLVQNSYFMVYVASCSNTSGLTDGKCEDPSTIENILNHSNHYFSYVITDRKIDHKNVSYPLSLSSFSSRVLLIPTVNYDYTLSYKYVEYKSNNGWLVNTWTTYTGFQFEESITERVTHTVSQKYPIENTYASFKFRISPLSYSLYEREYPKLQSIIANVSALIKVVYVAGQMLVGLFSTGRYYASLFSVSQQMIKSKKNMSGVCNNINNNNATFPKDISSTRILPIQTRKLNPIVYCQWMIFPKLNKKTMYVDSCRKKIGEFLSVENLIRKLYSSEIILSTLQEKASNPKNLSNSMIYLHSQINQHNLNDNSNLNINTLLRRNDNVTITNNNNINTNEP